MLSALGPHNNSDAGIAAPGTAAIIAAMRATGVRRIVAISASPVATTPSPGRPHPPRHDPGDGFIMRQAGVRIAKALFGKVYDDLARMEDLLRESGLDWTMLRPPQLTGKPLTGHYRTAVGRNVRGGRSIPRADVVHYMLAVVGKPETTGQVIGIATLACGLRPPKFEHGNGADSSGLACVFGKARVAPRLLGVDAVAFSAGQFVDGHLVCLGSAFDTAVTGGGQVAVPVRVGGCSSLGCEDVDGTATTGPLSAMDPRSDRDRRSSEHVAGRFSQHPGSLRSRTRRTRYG